MRRGIALVLGILLCLLAGCTPKEKTETLTVFCMDTVMDIRITGDGCEDAAQNVAALLQQLDKTWSYTDPDSVVYRLNHGAAEPDTQIQKVLDEALSLSQRTQGALNPKLGALSEAWGFRGEQLHIPSEEEIRAAIAEQKWDLGALIKGYAGQQAALLLEQQGVKSAILNLGGNVQTVGSKANGEPWMIGIQNPNGGDPLGIISVNGTVSVVTSGDYQRYFEQDGLRYHHIMDPKTGAPARSGLTSVTVISRDGMTADGLSTALFVMGMEQGRALWQKSDDFEAVFVLTDGKIYATEGVSLSGCEYEVITREE